jgi:hypothetical protein
MKPYVAALLIGGSAFAISGSVLAHHSFAMFDQEHPIELAGTVKEFRFVKPAHVRIFSRCQRGRRQQPACGILRAAPPSFLARDGWSSKTLKPGDEVPMTVDPLRSGAPAVRGTLTRSNTRTATRSSSVTDMRGHR